MARKKKCGCSQGRCGCVLESSPSVTVNGFGSNSEPYILDLVHPLAAAESDTLAIAVNEVEGGLQISAYPKGAPSNVQVFTANGTWTRPVGVQACKVICIGGGGGGGAGYTLSGPHGSNTVAAAMGGAGGAYMVATLYAPDVPASAAVVVGAGGTPGPKAPFGPGGNGGSGGVTSFGSLVRGGGGAGGLGGQFLPTNATVPGALTPSGAMPGVNAPQNSTTNWNISALIQPGGGGYGHRRIGASGMAGLHGQLSVPVFNPFRAGEAYTPGADGVRSMLGYVGTGGSGGGWVVNGEVPTGGDGSLYGGGGGGAGPCPVGGFGDFNGGAGAPGICVVMAW